MLLNATRGAAIDDLWEVQMVTSSKTKSVFSINTGLAYVQSDMQEVGEGTIEQHPSSTACEINKSLLVTI